MTTRTLRSILVLAMLPSCFDPVASTAWDESGSESTTTGESSSTSTGPGPVESTSSETSTTTGEGTSIDASSSDGEGEETETASICGDGVVSSTEECDDGEESARCDADCTRPVCGDAVLNASAGEHCDNGEDNGTTRRCNPTCLIGGGLDGTFGNAWTLIEPLNPPPYDYVYGLQSFHYSEQTYIYDVGAGYRFALIGWSPMPGTSPFSSVSDDIVGVVGASEPMALWVARSSAMWRYDIMSGTWQQAATLIPNGSEEATTSTFDSDGHVWYHVPNALVRYDPSDHSTTTFAHGNFGYTWRTHLAYDPITNSIAFAGQGGNPEEVNTRFTIYSIDDNTFTVGAPSGGSLSSHVCEDRSGHVYLTLVGGTIAVRQYNIVNDTFVDLPAIGEHDRGSTCVVSQDGFLYLADRGHRFLRLPLGRFEPPVQ